MEFPLPSRSTVNSHPDRLAAVGVVCDALKAHLPPEEFELTVDELARRFDRLGVFRLRDVNPPRDDYGGSWDEARARLYAPLEHTVAVHLELGTFTSFPRDRVSELVAGDGLGEFIRLDNDANYQPDVIADAAALPFRAGVIDRVGSNSTLEHVVYPHRVLEETYRVLKPGGVAFIAMPFVWPEHGYPDDHVRLTPGHFTRILPEIGFVDIAVDRDGSSGLYNTLHNAAKMASVDGQHSQGKAMLELHELVISMLALLIPLDRFFVDGARTWMHSVRVVARKPGVLQASRREWLPEMPFSRRALDLLADPITKEPLALKGRQLHAANTRTAYPLHRRGSINFLEPKAVGPSGVERAGDSLGRVRRRALALWSR